MTATLDDVPRKKKQEPTAAERAAEELVRRAREQGLSLTGPDGLLKQLTKTVLEKALNEELTEHLGHEKHGRADAASGNIRNGSRPKTVLTESSGEVQLEVPRDHPRLGLIGVTPCYRRRGLPKVLLAAVFALLRDRGISEVAAEVDAANTASNALLRKVCARRIGGSIELVRRAPH
jgi:putative transposase